MQTRNKIGIATLTTTNTDFILLVSDLVVDLSFPQIVLFLGYFFKILRQNLIFLQKRWEIKCLKICVILTFRKHFSTKKVSLFHELIHSYQWEYNPYISQWESTPRLKCKNPFCRNGHNLNQTSFKNEKGPFSEKLRKRTHFFKLKS